MNLPKICCKSNILVRGNGFHIHSVIADFNIAFSGSNRYVSFIFSKASTPCNNLVVNGYISRTGYERNISIIGNN